MSKPVISRYLSPTTYEAVRNDFVFLINKIKESGFEYGLQIRDDYLNLYYKGNSIGKISYKAGQKVYEIKIHRKFVDDSIVKGNQTRKQTLRLRELGAKEVHARIACPPLMDLCKYGKSINSKNDCIAQKMSLDEIRETRGLDSLEYATIEDLETALGILRESLCTECWGLE